MPVPRIFAAIPLLALTVAATWATGAFAGTGPELVVTPKAPHVDDNIRIAFTDARALPAGSELNIAVIGEGACASSIAAKFVRGPRNARTRYIKAFRPGNQIGGGVEWCQGKALIKITESKGERFVRTIARTTIRFSAKP